MPSQAFEDSFAKLAQAKPQERIPIVPGMSVRKTKGGIHVIRIHYSADPDRDPKTPGGAAWRKAKRGEYTSQAEWDREMEIVDGAGGGERIYSEILSTYFQKIVITDPTWQPGRTWRTLPGFDYGKTNPTGGLVPVVDHDGTIIFASEYYMPGLDVWQHAANFRQWPSFMAAEDVMCDPSIFDKIMQQREGKAISVAEVYAEYGIENLRPYIGNRQDIAFEQRLKQHWANLDKREPTVKIWAPGLTEVPDRPVYGQHDGCPSLLWELANIRRVKLTATQLMTKNPSEQIVDKDNHLHDCIAEGTPVRTLRGNIPIEDVRPGDYALTRAGWRRVTDQWLVRSAPIIEIVLADGRTLCCTKDHRIFSRDKFLKADELKYGMMLICTKESTVRRKSGLGWASISTAIQRALTPTFAPTFAMEASTSIRWYGFSNISGRCLKATNFITPITIPSTTSLTISSPFPTTSIRNTTKLGRIWTDCVKSAQRGGRKQKNGIAPQRVERGTASTLEVFGTHLLKRFAPNAALRSKIEIEGKAIHSVRGIAGRIGDTKTNSIMSRVFAKLAKSLSRVSDTIRRVSVPEFVLVSVVEVRDLGEEKRVYDLTVEEDHEFFAGGILVHNCMKYVVMTLPEPTAKSVDQRVQEAIADCVEAGDVTNAMRIAQDVRQQVAEEEQPSSMVSRYATDPVTGGTSAIRPIRMAGRFGRGGRR